MKRAVAAALVLVAVTACGADEAEPGPEDGPEHGDVQVFTVDADGKDVTCIVWDDYREAGLSCDWANAR